MRNSRPTIKDIAVECGVSANTVSRALRGLPHIHPDTRRRVLRIAQQIHYKRNLLARGLVLNRTESVGLIITDSANPNYSLIVRGVEDYLFEHNINVIVSSSTGDAARERSVIDLFLGRAVDGIIITPTMVSYDNITTILNHQVPVVLTNRYFKGHPHDCVLVDNLSAIRELTEHLIELGHKQILYFGGFEYTSTSMDRYVGYGNVMKERGLKPLAPVFCGTPMDPEPLLSCFREIMAKPKPPTAFMCYNDRTAILILQELDRMGLSCPKDLSITGFDDITLADMLKTPITTVAQPTKMIGSKAAELLLRRLNGEIESDYEKIVLDTKVAIRASTGPPSRRD
jgi:LacI family transcriptional regulator, galactose operon repressor